MTVLARKPLVRTFDKNFRVILRQLDEPGPRHPKEVTKLERQKLISFGLRQTKAVRPLPSAIHLEYSGDLNN